MDPGSAAIGIKFFFPDQQSFFDFFNDVAASFKSLITVAGLIGIEGTLAFLGLSVNLPTPSWGTLINEGTANNALATDPYIMMWPAGAMFLLLWSFNLIGDRLRQRFDIREGLL